MNAFDLKLSPEALSWIKQLEGFTPKAQELLDGRFVIGFGHIEQTDPDEILTELEADLLLRMDLAKIESLLGDHLTSEIRSEQWDGLVMLAFAVGAEEIACSEIIMQINLGNFSRAARHFLDYSASLVGASWCRSTRLKRGVSWSVRSLWACSKKNFGYPEERFRPCHC